MTERVLELIDAVHPASRCRAKVPNASKLHARTRETPISLTAALTERGPGITEVPVLGLSA